MEDVAAKNAEIARRLWEAASRGNADPLLQFHPKITWKTYGHGPNAGEHHGIEAVFRYLATSGEAFEDLRSELVDVMASDRGAVIRWRMNVSRGARRLALEFALFLTITEGVVERAMAVPFEDAESDAFFRLD